MKVMVVGEPGWAVGLAREGLELVEPPDGSAAPEGDDVAEIAAGLRGFESLFGEVAIQGVVISESSNLALAAVLVATKMRIPVVAVGGDGQELDRSQVNGRLIAHLADRTMTGDATAVAGWLRASRSSG